MKSLNAILADDNNQSLSDRVINRDYLPQRIKEAYTEDMNNQSYDRQYTTRNNYPIKRGRYY